jgi:serine/threonine protein phosphatase PrpC
MPELPMVGDVKSAARWDVLKASVKGDSHVRNGMPNQDSAYAAPLEGSKDSCVILCVADGHGDVKCLRSDVGARLAVETAVELLFTLSEEAARLNQSRGEGQRQEAMTAISRAVKEDLPKKIIRLWQKKVDQHCKNESLLPYELLTLIDHYPEFLSAEFPREAGKKMILGCASLLGSLKYTVYGATLLAVLITPRFMVALQLGDGDIVAVDDSGMSARLIAKDKSLIANVTASLSSHDALSAFRYGFRVFQSGLPAIVFMSTDGLSNAFQDDQAFLKVGGDLLTMLTDPAQGLPALREAIPRLLTQATSFSDDDVSIALAVRTHPLIARFEGEPTAISHRPGEPDDSASPPCGFDTGVEISPKVASEDHDYDQAADEKRNHPTKPAVESPKESKPETTASDTDNIAEQGGEPL